MSSDLTPSVGNPLCVFIAARGHSGSTMLELLLNRRVAVAALGELDQLPLQIYRDGVKTRWVGQCSCGERPMECPVWGEIIRKTSEQNGLDLAARPFDFPISDVGLAEEFGFRKPLQFGKYLFHRFARGIHQFSGIRSIPVFPYRKWVRNRDFLYRLLSLQHGVSTVVDSSKGPLQITDLARYSSLPVRILFLTRDPRGNAWSAIRRGDADATKEVRSWVSVNSRIYRRVSQLPSSSWMHVRYEDLCSDTEGTLDSIMEFLGVDKEAVGPDEERAQRHTIAGNKIRLHDLSQIRHDSAWQRNLTPHDLAEVRRVAGDFANFLGYDL